MIEYFWLWREWIVTDHLLEVELSLCVIDAALLLERWCIPTIDYFSTLKYLLQTFGEFSSTRPIDEFCSIFQRPIGELRNIFSKPLASFWVFFFYIPRQIDEIHGFCARDRSINFAIHSLRPIDKFRNSFSFDWLTKFAHFFFRPIDLFRDLFSLNPRTKKIKRTSQKRKLTTERFTYQFRLESDLNKNKIGKSAKIL